jgi:hypothetical protein
MTEHAHGLRRWRLEVAGLAAIAIFAVLAGRFWHPYYGFTRFVQLDEADARTGIHEIREHPVFTYEGFNGYDGAAYAQIAFHPLLDSPELEPALGNVPYRARRILASVLAWLIAGGNPARIANAYAGLNLIVWVGLAVLLWRALPVMDARSWIAWAGVMFSAGALHSVRLALTDLLGATLVTAAVFLVERGRTKSASGALALAGLARETTLAAVVALLRTPWLARSTWSANAARTLLVATPLFAWIMYVRWKAGPAPQGLGNFTWPIIGWLEKWSATLADFVREPNFRLLNTTTLLALIALTAQAAFFLRRRRFENPWWRVGAIGVVMMAALGTSVWEGHPGAATRVLLPMSVAFAVLATRERANLWWISAGSVTVFSGLIALSHVPPAAHEFASGRLDGGAYMVRLGGGWYGLEQDRRARWSWSAQRASLEIQVAPRAPQSLTVNFKIRAIKPRDLEVRHHNTVLWRGAVGEKASVITFPIVVSADGSATLELTSAANAVPESTERNARALGFAIFGVTLENRHGR